MALTVELVDLQGAEKVREQWRALVDRALEPNIFMEPTFALAAVQHLPESQRPRFALVWDMTDAGDARLLCVWPIETRSAPLTPSFVKTWESLYAVVGVPLIDRTRAADIADAVFEALGNIYGPHHLLLVPHLLKAGPTYGLLVSRALATQRSWSALSPHARAVLRPETSLDALLDRSISPTARKKLPRQRRKMETLGTVAVRSATTPDEIRRATEQFLVLENSGWKGKGATALLSAAGSATFARSLVRMLAREGRCRIDSLEIDGRPVAMMIVLTGADRAYFWKTAFDESFRAMSPGVHLTLELTARQLADPSLLHTDSCAVAGHSMIERYWPDRHEIADLAIALAAGDSPTTAMVLRRERMRRSLRESAKRALQLLRSGGKDLLPWRRSAATTGT